MEDDPLTYADGSVWFHKGENKYYIKESGMCVDVIIMVNLDGVVTQSYGSVHNQDLKVSEVEYVKKHLLNMHYMLNQLKVCVRFGRGPRGVWAGH